MPEEYHDHISGCIENIVFCNEENGFTVASLKEPRNKDLTCIVGTMPTIQPGETLFCEGIWKHHPKHGKQFEVSTYKQTAPKDLLGIRKYLESGHIKGVGPTYAKKIVDAFGLDTLKVIDETPSRLTEIEGIGPKRVELIEKHWKDQKNIRHVMIFLQGHHISPNLAQKIYKLYGDESIEKVKENPYALAKRIFGVGFKTADTIAKNLGFPENSPHRLDAGIEYLLWEVSNEGHVCLPKEELLSQVKTLLEVEKTLIEERLEALAMSGQLICTDLNETPFYWIKPLYLAEIGIAKELDRLVSTKCSIRDVDTQKALEWIEEKMGLRLASQQKLASALSLEKKIHIITGGPGTGKSTITKGILRITEKLTSSILLAAPTGRAAKRLGEITRKKAFTIHSLLEFDYQNGSFKKGKDNPLACDLLIIDEASMIDTQLMYSLLKAIPSHARVILIGDVDQLPSVGAGNVLKDLISSEKLAVTQLTQIFRQAAGSKIITNAHRINKGYFPDISNPEGSDFIFLEAETPEDIQRKILYLIQEEIPKKYLFDPLDDIQILSPMKKGGVGIENLNHLLQNTLNPSKEPLFKMGRTFHAQDKVIQLKNNYDKNVFNGDVGKIEKISLSEQELLVNFDGNLVSYDFAELDELSLAYAVSIHKYQGSECPCVMIPIHTSHFKLLYRNLLYTGVTRGKKLVILIGTKKALFIAIKNDEVRHRFTGLKHFLIQTLPSLADPVCVLE
jgi:exodeoxyribonuclease V alpha subunit